MRPRPPLRFTTPAAHPSSTSCRAASESTPPRHISRVVEDELAVPCSYRPKARVVEAVSTQQRAPFEAPARPVAAPSHVPEDALVVRLHLELVD
eukprot:471686-Prymnesium_polylepis.1